MLGMACANNAECRVDYPNLAYFFVYPNGITHGGWSSCGIGSASVLYPRMCGSSPAFTSLCRDVHFDGFQWPMIEDLLMDKDVLWFSHWHQTEDWDGLPAFPCLGDRSSRVCTHFAVGDQPGAGAAAK